MSLVEELMRWCDVPRDDLSWASLSEALAAAAEMLRDQLGDDVDVLRAADPAATVGSVGDEHFQAMTMLPARFEDDYDTDFAVRWAVTVQEVGERITGDWTPPRSLAEGLACLCIFDQTEVLLDALERQGPVDWRDAAEDIVLPDSDVGLLLDPAMDGADESEVGRIMGLPSFRPVDWFDPSGAAAG